MTAKTRALVWLRDYGECSKCHLHPKKIHVHHLDCSGGYPHENNDLDSLISLCASCHSITHLEMAKEAGFASVFLHIDSINSSKE